MNHTIQQKYLQTKVQTATPEQLLLMLVDGAIKFCKLSIAAINRKDLTAANNALIRTQDIITELNVTLDRTTELAAELARLYEYFNHRLIEANTTKKAAPAEEVLTYLLQLKESWMEAALFLRQEQSTQQASVSTGTSGSYYG